jgi:hypothetical protein
VVVAAQRWLARDDDRAARVRRLSARGRGVAAIARETQLAQDAVRDVMGSAASASTNSSAAARGNFFRRPAAPAASAAEPAAAQAAARGTGTARFHRSASRR